MITEREKIAHLLRRFGLGASETELDYFAGKGINGAIAALLDYESVPLDFSLEPRDLVPQTKDGKVRPPKIEHVQAWWLLRMMLTARPLEEKLTLFWHNHFATASMKVDVPLVMFNQNLLLRRNALGNFRTMLNEVAKDPAMLYWLDNQFNQKGKPNENFAREVMELFTLGIGHYTEKDIQEAARAFTGWSYNTGPRKKGDKPGPFSQFRFLAEDHDDGSKVVLDNKGNFNGDDVCDILCGQPQTSLFIAKKAWEWFAYLNPEKAVVERIGKAFRDSGLEIKALVRAIAESPEFYSEKCVRRAYKNPIDFCVALFRQLGYGQMLLERFQASNADAKALVGRPVVLLTRSLKAMGMEILNPPDVSGWKPGPDWISSATMVERIKMADAIFTTMRYPALGIVPPGTPSEDAAKLIASVFDSGLRPEKLSQLADACERATGGRLTAQNAAKAASAMCRLMFASPEFQFC
ncbi:MAG: DUF1800 domain-containing protein [Armatimonadetes bacterium]|nr:DUF1800 domain-containing protein [Armatimonadota bacterium]